MMAFRFTSNSKVVNAKMSNMVAVQMPFALSKALNDTAKTLVTKNKQDMEMIFDRPVTFTKNAFFFRRVKKGATSVTIRRKNKQSGRHYLEVQEDGGARPQTAMEKLFKMNLPYGGILRHVTPTRNTPLNQKGNMTPGFRNKVLSALQVTRDRAARSQTFGKPNKGRQTFFVPAPTHPLGQGRRAGVYQRNTAGNAKKVLNFIDRNITYQPRLRFDDRMDKYGKVIFPKKMRTSLKHAMATARFK